MITPRSRPLWLVILGSLGCLATTHPKQDLWRNLTEDLARRRTKLFKLEPYWDKDVESKVRQIGQAIKKQYVHPEEEWNKDLLGGKDADLWWRTDAMVQVGTSMFNPDRETMYGNLAGYLVRNVLPLYIAALKGAEANAKKGKKFRKPVYGKCDMRHDFDTGVLDNQWERTKTGVDAPECNPNLVGAKKAAANQKKALKYHKENPNAWKDRVTKPGCGSFTPGVGAFAPKSGARPSRPSVKAPSWSQKAMAPSGSQRAPRMAPCESQSAKNKITRRDFSLTRPQEWSTWVVCSAIGLAVLFLITIIIQICCCCSGKRRQRNPLSLGPGVPGGHPLSRFRSMRSRSYY